MCVVILVFAILFLFFLFCTKPYDVEAYDVETYNVEAYGGKYYGSSPEAILSEKQLKPFDNSDINTRRRKAALPDEHFNHLFIRFAYDKEFPKLATMGDNITFDASSATNAEVARVIERNLDIRAYAPDVYTHFTKDGRNYALFVEFDEGKNFHSDFDNVRYIKKFITYNKY